MIGVEQSPAEVRSMTLAVAGVSHQRTAIETREKLAVSAEQLPDELRALAARFPGAELVLLSTCNRTEIYLFGCRAELDPRELLCALADARGLPPEALEQTLYRHEGPAAVRHLFRVCAGLDSMILGEAEILGQVKQAYLAASEARLAGRVLHALFQESFRAGKLVRSRTRIAQGRVSIGSVALAFAQKIFSDLRGKTALVLGAGETAELVLEHLAGAGLQNLLVANRAPERAAELVRRHGGEWLPLDALGRHLHRPDILIGSTASPRPVVTLQAMREALAGRGDRPLLVLDLAVPRDVDAAVARFDNVFLYDIDDLQEVVAESLGRREAEAVQAEALIDDLVTRFDLFLSEFDLQPLLAELHRRGREVREQALEALFAGGRFDEAQRREVEAAARSIVNRLLHDPVDEVRGALREDNRYLAFAFFKKLFRLGRTTSAPSAARWRDRP